MLFSVGTVFCRVFFRKLTNQMFAKLCKLLLPDGIYLCQLLALVKSLILINV